MAAQLTIQQLLSAMKTHGASDLHLKAGLPPSYRVGGNLRTVNMPPMSGEDIDRVISPIIPPSRRDYYEKYGDLDFATELPDGDRFRINIFRAAARMNAAIRRVNSKIPTFEELLLPPVYRKLIENTHEGIVVVCGVTGSGKSTTLASMIEHINETRHENIVTIEDPVEYRTSLVRQVQVNPEANLSFAAGLRSILRQDPDVILVGEIRDRETAQISVQAALTGHLLLSTVHTNDSISAIARLRDLGVPEYLISSSLLAVMAQRLVRRNCPDCCGPDSPADYLFRALGLDADRLDFQPVRGKGCRRCIGTGYVGRAGIYELFEVSDEVQAMIVRLEPVETIRAAARKAGMRTLVEDGIEKIRQGITSVEEVVRVAGKA